MKKTLLFLFLIIAFGCKSNRAYYETPIKTWFSNNLNDISSYEPVEFRVIDSSNFLELNPKIETKYANLINVIQRKIDLTSTLINSITDSTAKVDLIQNRKLILEKINGNIINIPKLLELNNNITKDLKNVDKKEIEKIALLEGTNNRIEVEKVLLDQELKNIGTSINLLPDELRNGQFIYHKFRAKNSFGAFVLSSMIFKLDNNKLNVEKSEEIL